MFCRFKGFCFALFQTFPRSCISSVGVGGGIFLCRCQRSLRFSNSCYRRPTRVEPVPSSHGSSEPVTVASAFAPTFPMTYCGGAAAIFKAEQEILPPLLGHQSVVHALTMRLQRAMPWPTPGRSFSVSAHVWTVSRGSRGGRGV